MLHFGPCPTSSGIVFKIIQVYEHLYDGANKMQIEQHLGHVYTGPDKFLHGRILFPDGLFTWIRANSVAVVFTRIRAKFRPVVVFESRP